MIEIDIDKDIPIRLKMRGHDNRRMPSIPIPETGETEYLLQQRGLGCNCYLKKLDDGKVVMIIILPPKEEVKEVEQQ